MDTNSIIMLVQDKLPKDSMNLAVLKERLDKLNDAQRDDFAKRLSFIKLKSPIVGLILGLFFGGLGVDRFYKGNIGLGVLKIILLIVSYSLFFSGFIGMVAGSMDEMGEVAAGSIGMTAVGGIMLFALIVWVVADLFLVYKGIKKDNFAKIMMVLNNV